MAGHYSSVDDLWLQIEDPLVCLYICLFRYTPLSVFYPVNTLLSVLSCPSSWSLESADFGPGDTFRVPQIDSEALETLFLGTCIIRIKIVVDLLHYSNKFVIIIGFGVLWLEDRSRRRSLEVMEGPLIMNF